MKNSELTKVLKIISNASIRAAKKYGVHDYEHGRSYRPCPEPFAVHEVFNVLQEEYYVTAEAHQGGIWDQCKKKNRLPKKSGRKRYDLALWNVKEKPIALVEFKWAFNPKGFHKDADDLYKAGKVLGIVPILCLLAVKDTEKELKNVIKKQVERLKETYTLRLLEKSSILTSEIYCCGKEYLDEHVYFQSMACALKV